MQCYGIGVSECMVRPHSLSICRVVLTERRGYRQVVSSPDDPSALVTSTNGPTNGSAALVPQLFLTFTGTTLYIRTSSASTAIVNVSLATHDPDFAITSRVNTATANGLITVVGLPSDRATTLTMKYVASEAETRLDISNITIITTSNECVVMPYLLTYVDDDPGMQFAVLVIPVTHFHYDTHILPRHFSGNHLACVSQANTG